MRETVSWLLSASLAFVLGSVIVGLLIGLTWRVAAWVAH